MSLQPQAISPVPEETARVARAAQKIIEVSLRNYKVVKAWIYVTIVEASLVSSCFS